MKLLPYHRYEIQTSLTREEVVALLQSETEPRKWLRFSRKHRLFEGEVSYEGFKIMRIIHYRNSFIPIIRGSLEQGVLGVKVKVRMHLHPFVMAFMCIWFGGVGFAILSTGAGLISGYTAPSPMLLIPFAMLIFGWLLTSGGFWFEARKAKPLLKDLLQRKMRSEQGVSPDRQNPGSR